MNKYNRISKALEREEDILQQQFQDGFITLKEYNDAMRELQRDARHEYNYQEQEYDERDIF